jgi:hypothetical protein
MQGGCWDHVDCNQGMGFPLGIIKLCAPELCVQSPGSCSAVQSCKHTVNASSTGIRKISAKWVSRFRFSCCRPVWRCSTASVGVAGLVKFTALADTKPPPMIHAQRAPQQMYYILLEHCVKICKPKASAIEFCRLGGPYGQGPDSNFKTNPCIPAQLKC